MTVTDAHLHAVHCGEADFSVLADSGLPYCACTCAHSKEEFLQTESLSRRFPGMFRLAFGLHPQKPRLCDAGFLSGLLEQGRICAVGECGFDLFTEEFRMNLPEQEEAWRIQLSLARQFRVPLVIHDRKALDLLFRDARLLAELPAVVLHSFAFGPREAESLLSKRINACFSFGKQILNGNKKSIACVRSLPLSRLLFETDAPYQTLRGEERTVPQDILRVYDAAAELRSCTAEEIIRSSEENFRAIFRSLQTVR